MFRLTAYSTIYGNLSQENQDIYSLSLESFLSKNDDIRFYVFLIDLEVPDWLNFIKGKYPNHLFYVNINLTEQEKEDWDKYKTFRFCFRFLDRITDLLPTDKVASLDLDLFHENPFRSEEIDWDCVNMAEDKMFTSFPLARNKEFKSWSGENLINYLNAGVVIYSKTRSSKTMKRLSNYLEKIISEDIPEPHFHDQDILNLLMVQDPKSFRVLSERWNFAFKGVGLDIYKTQYFHMTRFEGVIMYHIFSALGDCRIDLMAYLANRHGVLQGSYLRTDKVTYLKNKEKGIDIKPAEIAQTEDVEDQTKFNKEQLDNLTVMVISRDQENTIADMDASIKRCLPGVDVLYVLDRCSDDSKGVLDGIGARYVIKEEGFGFDAPGARNFGVKHLEGRDVLFLDGDRSPHNLEGSLVKEALNRYDMTVVSVEFSDHRTWFTDGFMSNPWFKGWPGYRQDNGVYTCGILMKSSAINTIQTHQEGNLFHKSFTGRYGEEDLHLGFLSHELGLSCGAFPKHCYVDGNFSSARDILDIQMSEAKCKILCDAMLKKSGKSPESNTTTGNIREKRKFFKNKLSSLVDSVKSVDRSMYPTKVFYHIAQIGNWESIMEDQIARIESTGLYDAAQEICVSVLGDKELDLPSKYRIIYQSSDLAEYELPTLKKMKQMAQEEDFKCLYMHTKGASSENLYNPRAIRSWRKFLEHFTIDRHVECSLVVEQKDAVGPSLLKPKEGKLNGVPWPENACFGGNFWWSSSDYLKTLKDLKDAGEWPDEQVDLARASAETWIGSSNRVSTFMDSKQWTWGDPYYFVADEKKYKDKY